jgi:stage 0 sporulation protein B (sporulation initiation phosphotransferase)
MERRFGIRTAAGVMAVLAWAGLAFISFPLVIRLALGVTAAACVWLLVDKDRRKKDSEWRDRLILMLGHHRHDWMNELQVLFGYIRLKKYDNLPDYMDKIKTTALNDSYLCKLGNAELIVYLLNRRIEGGYCTVEVELEQEINLRRLVLGEKDTFRLVSGIAGLISEQDEPGMLSIGFDEEDGQLLVDFVYQGEADWESLKKSIGSFLREWNQKLEIREEDYDEGRAVVALALPFRT